MSYADGFNKPYRETTKEICNILNDDGGVIHSLERDGLEFKVNGFFYFI